MVRETSVPNSLQYGEVYRLKHDAVGKPRPFVVVSRNELNRGNTVIGIPFSSNNLAKKRQQPSCAFFAQGEGGLTADCVAMTSEIATVFLSNIQFSAGPLGTFDDAQMERLFEALKWSLNISS